MANIRTRIKTPKSVSKDEIFEVKTLVRHPMETGNRKDKNGEPIARNILHAVVCKVNNIEVLRSTWGPSISKDPYFAFSLKLSQTSNVTCTWTDDQKQTYSETRTVEVF